MRGAGRIARAVAIALALSGLAAAPITQAAVPAAEPAPLRVETAPPAVVRIEPAVLLVEPGGVVTGSIVISEIAMLYGADVRLAFDPALVSVVDADGAASGVQITPGPLLTSEGPYQIFTNQVSNTVGTITYIVFQFTPSPPFTGTDVLAKIQFRGGDDRRISRVIQLYRALHKQRLCFFAPWAGWPDSRRRAQADVAALDQAIGPTTPRYI